ncbi:MAG: (2Fe-2S)-binding protein [bacterium]
MFKGTRSLADSRRVRFSFEGREIDAMPGDTVAAALLASGVRDFRDTVVSAEPRGPFCLIGNCFDCLVEIDGDSNIQSCREPVRSGMRVQRQQGVRFLTVNDER